MYLIQREHRRRQRQAGKIRLRQQLEGEEEELDREPTAPDQGYQVDKLEGGEMTHNQKSYNKKSFRQRENRKRPKIPIVDAPPTNPLRNNSKNEQVLSPPFPWSESTVSEKLHRLDRPPLPKKHGSGHWMYSVSKEKKDAKIAFCWIEKVGCSTMKNVFAGLRHSTDVFWRPQELKKDPALTNGMHKAVMLRDPLARLLSGWLDKCRHETNRHYCETVFGGRDVSFRDAIFLLPSKYPDKVMDYHFMPQHRHCDGLDPDKLQEEFTSVEYFDSSVNIADSVRNMLESSGFDFLTDSQLQNILPKSTGMNSHATDANQKLLKYYTEPGNHNGVANKDEADLLIATALDFFFEDYLLLGIDVPLFAVEALHRMRNNIDHPWKTHAFTDDMMHALSIPLDPSLQQQQPSSASAAASTITAATSKMGSKGSSSYKNELDPYYQTVVEDLDSGNHSNLILYFLAMVMVYEVIRRALGTATHRMLSMWWRKRSKESPSDNDQTNDACHSTSIIDPINNKVQQRRARLIGAPWVKDRHRTSGR